MKINIPGLNLDSIVFSDFFIADTSNSRQNYRLNLTMTRCEIDFVQG